MTRKIGVFFAFLTAISCGQNEPHRHTYAEMVHFYDYSASAPLDVKELSSESRNRTVIHDITFAVRRAESMLFRSFSDRPPSCGRVFE